MVGKGYAQLSSHFNDLLPFQTTTTTPPRNSFRIHGLNCKTSTGFISVQAFFRVGLTLFCSARRDGTTYFIKFPSFLCSCCAHRTKVCSRTMQIQNKESGRSNTRIQYTRTSTFLMLSHQSQL